MILYSLNSLFPKTNQVCVSPAFSLFGTDEIKFRVIIYPVDPTRDGARDCGSFSNANSVGRIILKCDTDPSVVSDKDLLENFRLVFRFFLKNKDNCRSVLKNDFSEITTCGLPKAEEQWELLKFCERGNLVVGLEAVLGEEAPGTWEE